MQGPPGPPGPKGQPVSWLLGGGKGEEGETYVFVYVFLDHGNTQLTTIYHLFHDEYHFVGF